MKEIGLSIASSFAFLVNGFHLTGHWGWLSMMFLFAVSAVSIVPRPMLCVLAGSLYGLYGIPIALFGSMAGAAAAFFLGAAFSSKTDRLILSRHPTLQRVRDAIREEGWRVVLLCRLSPIAPSSLQSLLFGASSVSFFPFALATMVGTLPGIALEVALGSGARDALDGHLSLLQVALLIVGLCAAGAVILLIGRKLSVALRVTDRTTSKQETEFLT